MDVPRGKISLVSNSGGYPHETKASHVLSLFIRNKEEIFLISRSENR